MKNENREAERRFGLVLFLIGLTMFAICFLRSCAGNECMISIGAFITGVITMIIGMVKYLR